jgi:exosortase
LGFLFLLVPVPPAALEWVIRLLQNGSAEVTFILFRILDVPVFREGHAFSLRGIDIEIAPQCSSIRSGMALFVTSLLAGHLFLRFTLRKVLLAASTVPIAIFTNSVRIVSLTCLAVYVDPSFLHGHLHHRGGSLFSLLSVAILLFLIFLLQRSEFDGREEAGQRHAASQTSAVEVEARRIPAP